eukprot:369856-Amphidinium_carterae.2
MWSPYLVTSDPKACWRRQLLSNAFEVHSLPLDLYSNQDADPVKYVSCVSQVFPHICSSARTCASVYVCVKDSRYYDRVHENVRNDGAHGAHWVQVPICACTLKPSVEAVQHHFDTQGDFDTFSCVAGHSGTQQRCDKGPTPRSRPSAT